MNHDDFNAFPDAFDDLVLINPRQSWQDWATQQAQELEASKPNWRAWIAENPPTPTTAIAD